MKLSKRKSLVKKLDKVFGNFIKLRDKNTCVVCGSTSNPTCGHLITRAKYSTRWDEENSNCQCRNCNMKHEYYPEIYTACFVDKHGWEAYQALILRSNQLKKFTNQDLEDLIIEYALKINELKQPEFNLQNAET